ncbi:uncharacterized protein M6B38_165705 [Iris pallida]|uniref:Uncharacterized protein n=1 Tax=Iris pallida TaxID=29817 RepID=A0AAX6EXM9_IRIPA|nr:uncharacterized protein M6B38_165705 [Iris pallida]
MKKHFEFEKFWKDSCYYLEPEASNSSYVDIERYSDRFKKSAKAKREEFESTLKLTPKNFPSELLQDVQHNSKKLQLDQESVASFDQVLDRVLERLEHYAKIEEESKAIEENLRQGTGKEGKVKRKKSEDDKNDSEEEEEEQVEEESEDDYTQKKIPSDDEDDYNMQLD